MVHKSEDDRYYLRQLAESHDELSAYLDSDNIQTQGIMDAKHTNILAKPLFKYLYIFDTLSVMLMLNQILHINLGSGALSGKMLHVRLVENNKIDAYFRGG